MTPENPFDHQPQKATGMLNVLTILTIIGSVFSFVQSLWTYFTVEKSLKQLQEVMRSGNLEDAPAFVKSMVNEETLHLTELAVQYKEVFLILYIVGAVLCLLGAIQMRSLKKQGYMIWLTGELLPLIGSIALLGMASLKGFALIGFVFPFGMIILYTVSKKQLNR
jgi:hypothetical protein